MIVVNLNICVLLQFGAVVLVYIYCMVSDIDVLQKMSACQLSCQMTFTAMTASLQFKSLLLYRTVSVLLAGQQATEEMAARFVSMIPVIGGSTLFPGLFDIWLTSDVSEVMTAPSIRMAT
jgi:hypothetical protein